MKIRRFLAPTMREALAGVRDELGPDAVIISNRRVAQGIEIISAADYDPDLVAGALAAMGGGRRAEAGHAEAADGGPQGGPPQDGEHGFQAILRRMAGTLAGGVEPLEQAGDAADRAMDDGTDDPDAGPAEAAPATGAGPRVVWSQDGQIVAMRREVESLRRMLEYQLGRLAWDDLARREPFRAKVLSDLSALGIAPDLARGLANAMPAVTSPAEAAGAALRLLVGHLPVAEDGLLERGGCFALAGPSGAGKTTTIAKLAARHARRHGRDAVGLISIDSYRVGAREQLAAFARILGVPMKVADDPAGLDAARRALAPCSLVLVDTAGVGQRDFRLREQCALIRSQAGELRPLLVLPANADLETLDDVLRACRPLAPEACVITKIDETASLGPVLSAAMRGRLPIAQLGTGPRIPEDLHPAPPKRVWLVRKAVRLRQVTGRVPDEQYLAEHFGGTVAHG